MSDSGNTEEIKSSIGKIDPVSNPSDESEKIGAANKYIAICRKFLQINAIAKSRAAIADSVVTSGDNFGISELVESLRYFGFKAQFGYLKFDKRFDEFFLQNTMNSPSLILTSGCNMS